MKCSNCNADALYTYKVTNDFGIHYCQSHLPKFLTAQKNAGLLPLDKPAIVEPPKESKKTKAEPVVDETPEVTEGQ
jgi:hypothetical protein